MSDVSASPETLRPTEAARLELSRFVAEPGHALLDVFRKACELSAQTIGIERVGVWLFVENQSALRCVNLFERSKDEHSEGAVLDVADYPLYFSSLSTRKALPAEMAVADPRTAELAEVYLQPLGITSILDAAIPGTSDNLVGVVCIEHVGPAREWTTEDRDFAGSMADLLALKIQAAELHDIQRVLRTQHDRMLTLEKSEALAQMAAGVAHDFNNLLLAICGNTDVLANRSDLPADTVTLIRDIADAGQRGAALCKELLEFARPVGQRPVALNIVEATTAFLPVLTAAVGPAYPIQFDRPPSIGHVLMDKTQFTRVVLNLVINARDATPSGGPIKIRAMSIRASADDGPTAAFVLLEVSDQGVGMDESTRAHMFDPFFTTKSRGTGLGLPVVQRIVDRIGGFLRVDSQVGVGTTIQVYFPRISGNNGKTVAPASHREQVLS